MTEAVSISSIAKSKVAANKALKSLTIEQAERAIANLIAATETAKAREAERAEKKKAIAVKKLKTMMSEMGISAADIAGSDSTPPQALAKLEETWQGSSQVLDYRRRRNSSLDGTWPHTGGF